jgi:hypothetical protein
MAAATTNPTLDADQRPRPGGKDAALVARSVRRVRGARERPHGDKGLMDTLRARKAYAAAAENLLASSARTPRSATGRAGFAATPPPSNPSPAASWARQARRDPRHDPRREVGGCRLPAASCRLPAAGFQLPASSCRLPASAGFRLRLPASGFRRRHQLPPPASGPQPPASNLRPPTSDLRPPTSDLQPPTSNLNLQPQPPPNLQPQPPYYLEVTDLKGGLPGAPRPISSRRWSTTCAPIWSR